MISIELSVRAKKVKILDTDERITQQGLLGKAYATALQAMAELVPEFNTITHFISQDNESRIQLSDNLLWRESTGRFEVFDLSPVKAKGYKSKGGFIPVTYYLYDPETTSEEKILISKN